MKIKRYLQIPGLFLFLMTMMLCPLQGQNIKVFIMAGQSNMQGHGEVSPANINGTLANFMDNGGAAEFNYVRSADGSWSTREDVWVRYDHEDGQLLTGELAVGFGYSDNHIGPEFGFGNLLAPETDDQILIIKTCWGGKSLAVDFRPPSSGGTTGEYYDLMLAQIAEAIDNIPTDFPQSTGGSVEIAGMAWFQGWNDGDDQAFMDEYEQNLINLISDVRTDLNVPNLPFVIGLAGNGGTELEPEGTWIHNLQTQIVPAQINAALYEGHENVAYVDTRSFWRDGSVSPEPDFLHHWNNNAESYLRIGDELGREMNALLDQSTSGGDGGDTPEITGSIQANTNPALPSSYNFLEYVFPEPDDQGNCTGVQNATAVIGEVFMSQTHRHAIEHPLFFTIGERPALLQIAVTGSGAAPDVQVEGILNGSSLGTLCLNGPANLSASVNTDQPNFSDYFSVTLPKAWIKAGLQLNLSAGNDNRTLTSDDLKISPFTELNLVLVDVDIMDYNFEPHRTPIFDDFLQEMASAIPASVIRFGQFPATLKMPTLAAMPYEGNTFVIDRGDMIADVGLNTGNINAIGHDFVTAMQQAMGDLPNTIFFGNTLNLDPGGWGTDGSLVSYDYTDIFIHELGHALSLPHWGDVYRVNNPPAGEFSYPYAGELGHIPGEEAGGRGTAWNFNQASYEFVSPLCQADGETGFERSDCMQRNSGCVETRSDGPGPWDGFGDYSAIAMNNFLAGSESTFGQVEDRGEIIDFHLPENMGYPQVTLANGRRVFSRVTTQAGNVYPEDKIKLPGEEAIEQEVYLIYGSAHPLVAGANIIYDPIPYTGTLLPNIDPTDPNMFATLQNLDFEDAPSLYGEHRDVTLKLIYTDGTVRHALVPFRSFEHPFTGAPDELLSPGYFSLVVPGDVALCGVELYHRDFIISDSGDEAGGNINDPGQNITAENFMGGATLMATLDNSCNCPGSAGYIEPGTPCDDGNPFTANDVEDGFCNCAGVPVVSCGFITNGQFEENLAGWWTWGSDASSTNGEATFENIVEADAGIAQGQFNFTEGESYKVTFDAYAAQARTIEISIYLNEEPFTEYHRETVSLGATAQSFEFSFIFNSAAVTNGALEFNLAGDGATVFLDNVCLDLGTVEEEPSGEAGTFQGSGYGFNFLNTEPVNDVNFGAGFSFYSAVWPFMEQYPGAGNFQTGQGTWVAPNNGGNTPSVFYNTIEGGLGWWGDTRFATNTPKFIMGGVAHDFDEVTNGPGAGSTDFRFDGHRDWDTPGGKYGVAQLSPNLLWPPDGLNMEQGANGEFLGYGYHPLPLTDPMSVTNGVDWETGNQCWTLFMNAANFKGPVAFFIPTFWAESILDDPTYEGLFLDSRPSDPGLAFAQEFSAAPTVVGVDNTGDVYARTLPPVYPKTTDNSSEIIRDISIYSRDAKWNEVENWFNGGPVPSTQLSSSGTIQVDFAIDNVDSERVDAAVHTIEGPVIDFPIDQDAYAKIKMSDDRKAAIFEWDLDVVEEVSTGFKMPEFYKLGTANEWEPIPMAEVPASSGLLTTEPETTPRNDDLSYLTPLEPDSHLFGKNSPWSSPGPAAGPFTVSIGDGTHLTYYWYRFVDQPAIVHANLPEEMRVALQNRVEMIHTNWSSSDEYLPAPTGGTLVGLDAGLLVTPPAGLEIGYVPIVSRQGDRLALPVELLEFNGQLADKSILLNWITTNEINNSGFEVQKSDNGRDWQVIGFVNSQSAASGTNNYSLVDPTPFIGSNYYRLRQIDDDGTFEYSKVIVIGYQGAPSAVQVYPNPARELFTVDVDNALLEKVKISIVDNLGRKVWEYEHLENERSWRKEVRLSTPGVYFMSTQIGSEVINSKVVIND